MASTGNVFPATGENNAGIGATAWTSPTNIVSDNTTDASCNAAASSQYLVARNFDFSSIPAGATIAGITVRIEASESSAGTESLNAQLQNEAGTLVGSSKAAVISGTGKAVYTYGGTADVWGATLTESIVKDPNFGVRFWFTTSHNIAVDYVTMAVEYTTAATGDLDKSFPSMTISAAGAVLVQGEESITFPSMTISADGSVTDPPSGPLGDLAVALPMLTLVATGAVMVGGAATLTLPMLVISAAGVVGSITGSASLVIPMLVLTAAGVVGSAAAVVSNRFRRKRGMSAIRYRE